MTEHDEAYSRFAKSCERDQNLYSSWLRTCGKISNNVYKKLTGKSVTFHSVHVCYDKQKYSYGIS